MPKSRKYTTLNTQKQSTGGRPLIVFCLIAILLLTFYLREGAGGPVHTVRGAVMTVTAPVRMVGSVLAAPFGAVGTVISNATAPAGTLSELKAENERLTAEVAKLTEAQKTADRLEGLVGLKSTFDLTSTAAHIIGSSGDAWTSTVTLDKGSTAGFAVGMPVCSSGGVIGQIIEVSAVTSTVRLATDEQSGIAAMVQSSRAQGMLQGQPDGTLRLSYVPADAEVSAGDIVITSGIGGSFPKGLPLGTVSAVEKAPNDVYYTITVRPVSQAENNEEVLVVTSVGSDQVASDDEVAAANNAPAGSAAGNGTDAGGSAPAADAASGSASGNE